MTVFCLDEQRTEAWFEMEGGGRVHLQLPEPDDLKKIRKQAVKSKIEYAKVEGKAERFKVEDFDEDLWLKLYWDLVILEWEKLFDSKGNPIEGTQDNKILLLIKSQKFLTFINESLGQLKEQAKQQAEEAEKNS
jgi:hypothetical protein